MEKTSDSKASIASGDVIFEVLVTKENRPYKHNIYKVLKTNKTNILVKPYNLFTGEFISDSEEKFMINSSGDKIVQGWQGRKIVCSQYIFNCTTGGFIRESCDISMFLDINIVKSKLSELEREYPFL